MSKYLYPLANKIIIPLFPLAVTIYLQIVDSTQADEFFVLYSLSIVLSSVTDFGFRFYPYKVSIEHSFLFERYKIIFSLLSIGLYFVLALMIIGDSWLVILLLGTAIPFQGMSDITTHVLKANKMQKHLFNRSVLSWLVSLIFLSPMAYYDAYIYFCSVILMANVTRYTLCSIFLKEYKKVSQGRVAFKHVDYNQGASVFLAILKWRLPFIIYPVLFTSQGVGLIGIILGVASKFSEFGIVLFEGKHNISYDINKMVIALIMISSLFISIAYIGVAVMFENMVAPVVWWVPVFLVSFFGFMNQYYRVLFYVKEKSKYVAFINVIAILLIVSIMPIINQRDSLVATVAIVEVVTLVFYFIKGKKIDLLSSV